MRECMIHYTDQVRTFAIIDLSAVLVLLSIRHFAPAGFTCRNCCYFPFACLFTETFEDLLLHSTEENS
jgi:hypothetical protein